MSMAYVKLKSSNRVTGNAYNFIVNAVNPLSGRYLLKCAYINSSFYNVNSTNNIIYFTENSTAKQATLTAGFYTSANIAAALASALTSASGGFAGYTVTYSSITGKLIIGSTQNFSFTFATNTTNSLGPLIGYNTDTALSTSATADSLLNLTPTLAFHIEINNYINIRDLSTYTGTTFIVPLTVNSSNYITYEPAVGFEQVVAFQDVNQFRVRVLDDSNMPIQLQSDWYMILSKVD
jgi:hypothetical protein